MKKSIFAVCDLEASYAYNLMEAIDERQGMSFEVQAFTNVESHKSFIAGADWQAKQSPWISVKERPPKHNIEVIICHEREFYIGKMYHSMQSNWWRVSDDERTDIIVSEDDSWMPIPSFDETF